MKFFKVATALAVLVSLTLSTTSAESSDCHCDGTAVHCSDSHEEEHCSCATGALTCEEHLHFDCHCDGTEVHCTDGTDESMCHCESDGEVHCDASAHKPASAESGDKPYAQVILTTLITNLVTLAGLTVVAVRWFRNVLCPAHRKMSDENVRQWKMNIIPMFACGAMMATVFFLILPEAFHMIAAAYPSGHHDHNHRMLEEEEEYTETDTTWRWGTAVLGGYFVPIVTHALIPHTHEHDEEVKKVLGNDDTDEEAEQKALAQGTSPTKDEYVDEEVLVANPPDDEQDSTNKNENADEATGKMGPEDGGCSKDDCSICNEDGDDDDDDIWYYVSRKNLALLLSLTIADFMHQFSDGVFIGTAWYLCDESMAVTIAVATVIHCFPHQLADFLLMVNQCGLKEWQALLVNFLTGMGTVLGGVTVIAADLNNAAIGIILCIGGGIFVHVTCSECQPLAKGVQRELKHKVWGWLGFLVGAIPIGLVLLNHEHCGGH